MPSLAHTLMCDEKFLVRTSIEHLIVCPNSTLEALKSFMHQYSMHKIGNHSNIAI